MSQLLYGEAEAVTRQAFREVLLEATKARLRERFGEKIAGLARLAIDELMDDVLANLDIEARIQERNRARTHAKERVRDVFGNRGSGREARDTQADKSPHREGEGGETKRNEDPGPGRDENR